MKNTAFKLITACSIALNLMFALLLHDACETGRDAFGELQTANETSKSLIKENKKLQSKVKELKKELANRPK